MGFNLLTWWTGATFGTWLGLRGKTQVGTDDLGNAYYEGGRDTAGNPIESIPALAGFSQRRPGLAAAMAFNVRVNTPQGEMCIAVVEVLEFDATLKITRMRAYWAPDDVSMTPASATA